MIDEQHKLVAIAGITRDITSRIYAEERKPAAKVSNEM
jgi:hypothetical protein